MNTVGARRAALAMASMHPADRRWMLARLPKTWRPVLKPLIEEARRFASFDADLVQAALDGQDSALPIDVPAPDVFIAVVNTLSLQWAARVLVAASDHTEIYLAACNKIRGDAIRQEMSRLPAALPRRLAESMARCLSDSGQALRLEESTR